MTDYSLALIALLKGFVYEHQKDVWNNLLSHEASVKNYFTPLGVRIYLDKSEGYAFLQQIEREDEDESEFPRLIGKRQLSASVSLVCLILRKYLLEKDAAGGSTRVMITKEQIIQLAKPFLKDSTNEVKQIGQIESAIGKLIDEKFLREIEGVEPQFEINRIIKAFINAEIVENELKRLEQFVLENKQENGT